MSFSVFTLLRSLRLVFIDVPWICFILRICCGGWFPLDPFFCVLLHSLVWIQTRECIYVYRVYQQEYARLREGVSYVKVYGYNPKHRCPKLNGYGDNGQRNLKLWQLLHTCWLPNTYLNWQEYVVSVMLISVRNIKLTCEWHKAIKLNYKKTRTHVIIVLRVPSTIHDTFMANTDGTWLTAHSGMRLVWADFP